MQAQSAIFIYGYGECHPKTIFLIIEIILSEYNVKGLLLKHLPRIRIKLINCNELIKSYDEYAKINIDCTY